MWSIQKKKMNGPAGKKNKNKNRNTQDDIEKNSYAGWKLIIMIIASYGRMDGAVWLAS